LSGCSSAWSRPAGRSWRVIRSTSATVPLPCCCADRPLGGRGGAKMISMGIPNSRAWSISGPSTRHHGTPPDRSKRHPGWRVSPTRQQNPALSGTELPATRPALNPRVRGSSPWRRTRKRAGHSPTGGGKGALCPPAGSQRRLVQARAGMELHGYMRAGWYPLDSTMRWLFGTPPASGFTRVASHGR